jgi:hypothetical protein
VLTLDDEGFETYLKQFRPLVPDALPTREASQESWRRRSVLRTWVVGATAMVILGVLSFQIFKIHVADKGSHPALVQVVLPVQPLTMRDANALLSIAPSYKAAVDSMAFHEQGSTIPKDRQSALAVLAKEKIKL